MNEIIKLFFKKIQHFMLFMKNEKKSFVNNLKLNNF